MALIDQHFEDIPPRGLSNILVALAYLDRGACGFSSRGSDEVVVNLDKYGWMNIDDVLRCFC